MTDDHLKIYVNATRPATLNDGVGLVAPNVVAKTRGCHPTRDFRTSVCPARRNVANLPPGRTAACYSFAVC
jgi:hypothetical protein